MAARTSPEPPAWYRDLTAPALVSGTLSEATSVCHDSRQAGPGAVFVAIPGFADDGNRFIPDAVRAGARAVIVQRDLEERWLPHLDAAAAFVAVPDARAALAEAAAGFYGHPAQSLGMAGVTGTDGKTTTTHLVAHVLSETGRRAGYLSSVALGDGVTAELNASHMTTLEASEVQRRLAHIRDAGARYAVVEASSIGLDLHRVDQCEFDVGVFTNLAPDHLDYHGTLERYRDAKALLFRMLDSSAEKGVPKAAVVNADDPASAAMLAATRARPLAYGLHAAADVTAVDITLDGFGTRFRVRAAGETIGVRTGLPGAYNVANCLAAVAVALSQGIAMRDAAAALERFPGVPGRMELIDEGQPFRVVVDIASTEQSMGNVLSMLRPLTPGRLAVVFGAAGERDRERRHGIARAVAAAADFAVVTTEDPRSEDPAAIIGEIAGALDAAGFAGKYEREVDRRTAIERAFALAAAGDTVLLAGKGTEQSIVIGRTHHAWDDRRVARELLRGRVVV